jgi:hypothetical protein
MPPEFIDEFIKGGWRRVERLYNVRTDLMVKWLNDAGKEALIAKRKANIGKGKK